MYVAGGAVRDMLLDRSVKDIDCWYFSEQRRADHPEQYGTYRIVRLDTAESPWGDKVDVIGTNQPGMAFLLESFDFGICQVGYANGIVTAHDNFYKAVAQKRFLPTRPPDAGRLARLQAKYPGWTL